MECPECGLPVLVVDGAITAHQRPDTLQPCNGKATPKATTPSAEKHEDSKPAEKEPAAKAPAKAAAPSKTSKTTRKS